MATILVVDDDAIGREFLVALLSYGQHHLLEAADGGEALQLALSHLPDLVIADILMPTMDGFEFVRRLRAEPNTARIPVIFYTASYLQQEAYSLAERSGVSHILLKPTDPDVLLSTVSLVLDVPTPVMLSAPADAFRQEHMDLSSVKLAQTPGTVVPRLTALVEMGRQMNRKLEPLELIQSFCHMARDILGAKYAVVVILEGDGHTLRHFITSGISAEEEARIGAHPTGRGLLGRLAVEFDTFRVANISADQHAVGFPAHHPHMQSFLGAPIVSARHHYGWLYLTDKIGSAEFTEEDEGIAASLTAQVAVAYENAVRYQELQHEIAERRRAEEKLRQLNEELETRVSERTGQLEAVNKELEAFSYSVSHDLRAPLRVLDGFSHELLHKYKDKLDDQGQHYLTRIQAASQRMGQLIDDLLQLSRLSRMEISHAQVDLSRMAQEIAAELQEEQPERQVEFIVEGGLVAGGDDRLLRVVLENLLGNAWKFTTKKPYVRIEFGATEHNGQQVFYVRDNGAGFDVAFTDRLFGAFQRLHRESEFEGTGIGLATVRRIITRHRGQIWADGAVDEGATFYFTLAANRGAGG